uniref:Dickkopf WNT signaling pathway inhibitor 2 n=1 Tax=Callorhinchus milii TaxID=7868 RepID=A0A4W3JEB2_CALMI
SQIQPCSSDKECGTRGYCQHSHHQSFPTCLSCRRRKKRCHRDAMCCPGNYCSNGTLILFTESLSPGICIQLLEGTNHRLIHSGFVCFLDLFNKHMFQFAGHEGDSCLRSSDCAEGFCCARHFWTKICKPVLRQGEVCTKQRRKGSHGLELFQRCDCAKGLSCKIWKEAKSRLHICQKV